MAWSLSRLCGCAPRVTCVSVLTKVLPLFYSKFEVDVIDDFTSQLMQKKIDKWELQKRKSEALVESSQKNKEQQLEDCKLDGLGSEQVGFLLQNAIDNENNKFIISIINLCLQHNKAPPFTVLINILSVCSQNGDKDTVCQVRKLCSFHYPILLRENSDFNHFIAEAVWVKGDVSKALDLFDDVYRQNPYLRRRIRLMLKCLIADLVANRSEAALWKVINFSEQILNDFQDFFPLTCVWQACFLSEWFTDQCIALDLLKRNSGLCKSVINRIPYVVFVSLKCHRTEVVYRLLEVLLKYKMKQQYSNVLVSLLDYQFRVGDLRSCSEIIHWATENDVPLPRNHHIKLINLLVNQKMKKAMVPLKPKSEESPKYNFKF